MELSSSMELGTRTLFDEELLSSGRPEGRKKVYQHFSRTAENGTGTRVAIAETRPGRASRHQSHRDEETRRDLSFLLGRVDPLTCEHSWADQGLLSRASVSPRSRTHVAVVGLICT
ncbi:hypothetical protein Taro_033578 [Colocasia esculenta]|uniref:Uncharacterized protein n=1 Tax=Colocasia esculenta TaxID=4460 RepID=A0A843W7D9_COLES|nr:hypothetical protein [Colocasia esculenta]